MNPTARNVATRAKPRRLSFGSRQPTRQLLIESLEHRCPLDASGMVADLGQVASIPRDAMIPRLSPPAITCYSANDLVFPQPAGQPGGRVAHPEPLGNDWYAPPRPADDLLAPPDSSALTPPADPVDPAGGDSSGKTSEPVAANPPSGTDGQGSSDGQDPLETTDQPLRSDLGEGELQPQPIRFVPPQGPAGSISLVAHVRGDQIASATNAARSTSVGSNQPSAVAGDEAQRARGFRRSETSLSKTRYYDPDADRADQLAAQISDALHGDSTTRLRQIARHALPHQAGIAIGSVAAAQAGLRRVVQPTKLTDDADREPTPDNAPTAAEERSAAFILVTHAEMPTKSDAAVSRESRSRQVTLPTDKPPQAWEQTRAAGAQGGGDRDAAAASGSPLQTDSLLPHLSRWAVVGLIISHQITERRGSRWSSWRRS